jgi:crossover junction endodeoxyribonuclease RuvC
MVQRVLAIDPGQKGALAWVNLRGDLIQIEDIPLVDNEVNAKLLANLVVAYGSLECAVVERQQAMPPELQGRRQGNASAFKHGTGYGIIIGVLAALNIPTFFIAPSQWKPGMSLSKDKELSRKKAIDRWPSQADEYFKLKKNEGRAEAALLAVFWIQSDLRSQMLPTLQGEETRPNSRRRLIRRYQETDPTTVSELEHS